MQRLSCIFVFTLALTYIQAATGAAYWRAFSVFPKQYADGHEWLNAWSTTFTTTTLSKEVEEARFQLLQGALEMELELLFRRLPISLSSNIKGPFKKFEGERAISVIARKDQHPSSLILHPSVETPAWNHIGEFDIVGRLEKKNKLDREHYFLNAGLRASNGEHGPLFWKKFYDIVVQDYFADSFQADIPLNMAGSFPRLAGHAREYLEMVSRQNDINGGKFQSFTARINMDQIKKNKRHTYRYLRRMQGAFNFDLVMHNPPFGPHYLRYDSQNRIFQFETSLGMDQVKSGKWPAEMQASANIKVNLHGVRVELEEWPLLFKYRPETLTYEWFSLGRPKKIEIKGNALMIIPLFMAKNVLGLEKELNEFFDLLSSAQERRGHANVHVSLAHDEKHPKQATVAARLVAPFRQSFLIKLGMGMIGNRLNPPAALLAEWEQWRREIFNLLLLDFNQARQLLERP